MWILFFLIIIALAFIVSAKTNEQSETEKKEKEEERERLQKEYENDLENLSREYGAITKKFEFWNKSKDNCVLVFAETKKAWIMGQVYDFKDILECSITDNSYIKKGEVTYKTKTSTGSMIGRAVVGGVLTGGVGALIGGATAKKKTVAVPKGEDKVIHDYTVLVNVNSLTTPVIRINCGRGEEKANEIVAVMNVIIHKNNK